jgi:hypothetical protein
MLCCTIDTGACAVFGETWANQLPANRSNYQLATNAALAPDGRSYLAVADVGGADYVYQFASYAPYVLLAISTHPLPQPPTQPTTVQMRASFLLKTHNDTYTIVYSSAGSSSNAVVVRVSAKQLTAGLESLTLQRTQPAGQPRVALGKVLFSADCRELGYETPVTHDRGRLFNPALAFQADGQLRVYGRMTIAGRQCVNSTWRQMMPCPGELPRDFKHQTTTLTWTIASPTNWTRTWVGV